VKVSSVGLIAGGGELPLIFLKAARAAGVRTAVFGIKGEAGEGVKQLCDVFYSVPVTNLSLILKYAKKENIKDVLFLGYVKHTNIFKNVSFDLRTIKILSSLPNLSADSIMNGVFVELEKEGIRTLPSTFLMEEALAPAGFICGKRPDKSRLKDIEFGYKMARGLAGLDIGQTVIVKNGIIAAAEAQEGTDETIVRGAKVAGKGFIVVKTARPKQDLRYDVPVIGLKTVELILKHGGAGIAVEAGRTFVLGREELSKAAGNKIFIYGTGKEGKSKKF